MQSKLKNKATSRVFSVFLILLLILFSWQIARVSDGVRAALRVCAYALIPTLFPFLVLTDLILSLEGAERMFMTLTRPLLRPLRLSKHGGVAFFLGAFFGFPMGAKAVAHYYKLGAIQKEEAERLLLFSGNASPFFLIGSVGLGMLSSLRVGIYLYALELFVSIFCGFLLGRTRASSHLTASSSIPFPKEEFSVPRSVRGAVRASLFISGYVLFFSALCSVILPFLKSPFLSRMAASFFEIATACSLCTASKDALTLPFCAFSVAFSGLSVFFQTQDCITETDLSLKSYLPVKLLCGCAAFFLTALLLRFG